MRERQTGFTSDWDVIVREMKEKIGELREYSLSARDVQSLASALNLLASAEFKVEETKQLREGKNAS